MSVDDGNGMGESRALQVRSGVIWRRPAWEGGMENVGGGYQ